MNNDTKKISKKEARQAAYKKLVVALSEYKTAAKGKKFEKKLRKVSRLFASDVMKAASVEQSKNAKDVNNGKKAPNVKPAQQLEERL
jgi:hypothetical protein